MAASLPRPSRSNRAASCSAMRLSAKRGANSRLELSISMDMLFAQGTENFPSVQTEAIMSLVSDKSSGSLRHRVRDSLRNDRLQENQELFSGSACVIRGFGMPIGA